MDKKKSKINSTPSVECFVKENAAADDMINRYGTYNIQSTADTENEYPQIAQGLSKKQQKR